MSHHRSGKSRMLWLQEEPAFNWSALDRGSAKEKKRGKQYQRSSFVFQHRLQRERCGIVFAWDEDETSFCSQKDSINLFFMIDVAPATLVHFAWFVNHDIVDMFQSIRRDRGS